MILAGGHYYKCTVNGTTGSTEPAWPTDGTAIVDNLATWVDLGTYTDPYTVGIRLEDMALVSDVQIDGTLSIVAPVSRDYDHTKAWLSSALIFGDLQARVTDFFHQANWTGVWQDSRIGSDTTAKYNNVAYPIAVSNEGAIKERWRIEFTSSTTFKVVGEYHRSARNRHDRSRPGGDQQPNRQDHVPVVRRGLG